jgi:hypothetical protein
MEIEIPAAFVGVSEEDGMRNQMDFGQFLVEGAASRERDALVQPRKVIEIYPNVCNLCGWESPDHDPNFHCGKRQKKK